MEIVITHRVHEYQMISVKRFALPVQTHSGDAQTLAACRGRVYFVLLWLHLIWVCFALF